MARPKVMLPKGGSSNEIVTLDWKQFGSKCILKWSFKIFVQGKLIPNKKEDTIAFAMNDCWNMSFGILVIGYYAENQTEFANIKMDELTSKLGISVKYGPSYSA